MMIASVTVFSASGLWPRASAVRAVLLEPASPRRASHTHIMACATCPSPSLPFPPPGPPSPSSLRLSAVPRCGQYAGSLAALP
eukprot:3201344-Rhodomonas_salina.1